MSNNSKLACDQDKMALINQTKSPREIAQELDKHIVGQQDAKKAVAIALRNRWRRMHLKEELQGEVTPKNILMIGPTGVGKTEIARRLAKLSNAPFIKVEATKYTEVGYVGRDTESIIRDLADIAVKMSRESAKEKVEIRAKKAVLERILDILIPPAPTASKTKKEVKLQQIGFANEPAPAASHAESESESKSESISEANSTIVEIDLPEEIQLGQNSHPENNLENNLEIIKTLRKTLLQENYLGRS